MFKRLAWLWVAMLMVTGPATHAAEKKHSAPAPKSQDRLMAPDEFPANVVKILRTSNKAQTNSYVPVVFTMRNNNPFSVIRFLRRPVQLEEGALFTFVTPEGNGGKVLFVVPDYMVDSLSQLVQLVDRPGLTTSNGLDRRYRQLKHRRASAVSAYVDPQLADEDFLATAASFSTGNGADFVVDPLTNALFWQDAPSGSQALDNALTDWLDVPTAMIQFVVKIYELDAYNDGALGLDYMAWKNGPGQNLFAVGAYSEYGSFGDYATNAVIEPLGTGANGAGSFESGLPRNNFDASGYNYAYRYEVSSAFFDFLAVKGKAKVLNQAKLAALNSRPASMSAGNQILYYKTTSTDPSGIRDTGDIYNRNDEKSGDGYGTEGRIVTAETTTTDDSGNIVPMETGLSLEVTPTIGEKTIDMDVALDWSDFNNFDSNGMPQINSRNLNTTMRLGVGDEVVIGGLKRQVTMKAAQKVPFFGSLPVIGYMFGGEKQQNKNTEMVVALSPIAIMDYKIAGGLGPNESEQLTIDQVKGKADLKEPATTWGFDMLGLDPAKSQTIESCE